MIGEIKSANAESLVKGEADLLWYETQIRDVMERELNVTRMILPPPLTALSFPTLAPANCPQTQQLFVDPPINGIYTYFCEPDFSVLIKGFSCRTGRRAQS
jgi:hypothetical protein